MTRLFALQRLPILATLLACILLYTLAAFQFEGFLSQRVFIGFLRNTTLGLTALGMTFVILSGGIDLSVGAVVAFGTVVLAALVEQAGWHPAAAIGAVLLLGTAFGAGQGTLIHAFNLPPFLVTLGGMYVARGLAFLISLESIRVEHDFFSTLLAIRLGPLPLTVLIFLAVFVLAIVVAHGTRFGRTVYAIGGSQSSAELMGLAVARAKIGVYAISGFCAALGAVTLTMSTFAGKPTNAVMLELDAIAVVVIGGTLLTGGVGYVAGTFVGLVIFGMITSIPVFMANFNSTWARIAIGALLLLFILLQKGVQHRIARSG